MRQFVDLLRHVMSDMTILKPTTEAHGGAAYHDPLHHLLVPGSHAVRNKPAVAQSHQAQPPHRVRLHRLHHAPHRRPDQGHLRGLGIRAPRHGPLRRDTVAFALGRSTLFFSKPRNYLRKKASSHCGQQLTPRFDKKAEEISLSLASTMAETTATNRIHVLNVEDGDANHKTNQESGSFCVSVPFMQKVFAEVLGTYFVVFAGCGSVVVNLVSDNTVTFPRISIIWGLVVMVMVYSVGHISGAHFNPAVTIAFAVTKRFPLKQEQRLLELPSSHL